MSQQPPSGSLKVNALKCDLLCARASGFRSVEVTHSVVHGSRPSLHSCLHPLTVSSSIDKISILHVALAVHTLVSKWFTAS